MTMPLSLTSSRYTGAAARRSLERASVVSSITSCPIQASGILLPSECETLGLSLSIIAFSSDRSPPASVGYLCRRLLSPRHTFRLARTAGRRSEEHTSELQSRQYLVCRLLLEKKKKQPNTKPLSNNQNDVDN